METLTVSTETTASVQALIKAKKAVKNAGDKHVSARQKMFESMIADVNAYKVQNPTVSNKDIAIEYNLLLDAVIPEGKLKNERAIFDYVALNSNISNTIDYRIAVKLERLKPSNSRLNACKNDDDYSTLVTTIEGENNQALLDKNPALIAHLKGKSKDELLEFAKVAKILANAIKE